MKNLKLHRETVRHLTNSQLDDVVGGISLNSCYPTTCPIELTENCPTWEIPETCVITHGRTCVC
jgi:hypothetical protein